MFWEVFWKGYETSDNKFFNSFEKAIEIAKKYTNDVEYLGEYELFDYCILSKYELDNDSGEYSLVEQYEYSAKTDEITKL